jgi:hypothetical protein
MEENNLSVNWKIIKETLFKFTLQDQQGEDPNYILSNRRTQPLRLKLAAGSWQNLSAKSRKPICRFKKSS